MHSSAPDQPDLLQHRRAAYREHRFDVAFMALRSAHELSPLDVEDLLRLADCAWWLGALADCLRLTEDTYDALLSEGRSHRAAAQALEMGGLLAMRGEYALASGWPGRARRLLADQPVGSTHGLLWYLDLAQAIEENRSMTPHERQQTSVGWVSSTGTGLWSRSRVSGPGWPLYGAGRSATAPDDVGGLTRREVEVLCQVATGRSPACRRADRRARGSQIRSRRSS